MRTSGWNMHATEIGKAIWQRRVQLKRFLQDFPDRMWSLNICPRVVSRFGSITDNTKNLTDRYCHISIAIGKIGVVRDKTVLGNSLWWEGRRGREKWGVSYFARLQQRRFRRRNNDLSSLEGLFWRNEGKGQCSGAGTGCWVEVWLSWDCTIIRMEPLLMELISGMQ